MNIYERKFKDRPAIVVESGSFIATFLPQDGGKLVSLKVRGSGKELMVVKKEPNYKVLAYDGDYVSSECRGFDDMFPTIDPVKVKTISGEWIEYPDHGEICRVGFNFEIKEDKAPTVSVTTNKNTYEVGETAQIEVTVNDPENQTVKLNVKFNGASIASKDVANGTHSFTHKFTQSVSQGKFEVEVIDGAHTVTASSVIVVNSKAPTVSVSSIENGKVDDNVMFDVNVENAEGTYEYEVYYSVDGETYELITSGSSALPIFSTEFTAEEESENYKIKVVVKNGIHTVEAYSNVFTIEAEASGGGSAGGMNCNAGIMLIEFMSLITLLTFIIRKTRR